MSNTNYTFAVAYIRALETNLFSDSMMNQLAACKTYEECVRFLQDKGWGNGQGSQDGDPHIGVVVNHQDTYGCAAQGHDRADAQVNVSCQTA